MDVRESLRGAENLRFRFQMNNRLRLECLAAVSKVFREFGEPIADELLSSVVFALPQELISSNFASVEQLAADKGEQQRPGVPPNKPGPPGVPPNKPGQHPGIPPAKPDQRPGIPPASPKPGGPDEPSLPALPPQDPDVLPIEAPGLPPQSPEQVAMGYVPSQSAGSDSQLSPG